MDLCILGEDGKEILEPLKEGNITVKLPGPLTLLSELYGEPEETKRRYYSEYPGYFSVGDVG